MTDRNIRRLAFAAAVALGIVTVGCPTPHSGPKPPLSPHGVPPAVPTLQVRYLDQGWSQAIRDRFHYTSQGSELIPYDWFLTLELPNSTALFKDDLRKYGLLFEPSSSDPAGLNPDGLPIGFALHKETETVNGLKEPRWLGLTCAACHTGAIAYKAKPTDAAETTVIIDGAPSSSDLGAFLTDLRDAVQATNADPQKLKTFAARVVSAGHGSSTADVETRFKLFASQFAEVVRFATPTHAWGPGRVDAFGVILDRVCDFDLPQTTDTFQPPDAPVSYPFLWYSGRQDHVQWHGEVDNHDWIHRLGRNTGEVIGVFARVDLKPGKLSYVSSVDPVGLGNLDDYVMTLKAPKWPEDIYGPLNQALVAHGSDLFHQWCGGKCHADVPAAGQPLVKILPTPLSDVNTDDAMTMLVHTRSSPTAGLAGKEKLILLGGKFGPDAPAADILGNVGAGTLLGRKRALVDAYFRYWLTRHHPNAAHATPETAPSGTSDEKAQATAEVPDSAIATSYRVTNPAVTQTLQNGGDLRSKIGYEARPLAGIWATSPYLHNGSVPNLAQLLRLDPRQDRFYVGSLAFDPAKVGYVSDGSRGGAVYDTKQKGNSNSGHEYGVQLPPADKQAIIEYLKSL